MDAKDPKLKLTYWRFMYNNEFKGVWKKPSFELWLSEKAFDLKFNKELETKTTMSKEAKAYFIKEWGTGFIGATLQSEKGLLKLSMEDVYNIMQEYAEHHHKEKMKGVKEFLRMILNSYKMINVIDDYRKTCILICESAEKLNNEIVNEIEVVSEEVKSELISVPFLMELHPDLNEEQAKSLMEFSKSNTIRFKECYGGGDIMYPMWKNNLNPKDNEKKR
jgi:hypothetical protein